MEMFSIDLGKNAVYQFVRAAITKYHRVDALNNRNLFSHISDMKMSVVLFSSEASLFGLQMATFYVFT